MEEIEKLESYALKEIGKIAHNNGMTADNDPKKAKIGLPNRAMSNFERFLEFKVIQAADIQLNYQRMKQSGIIQVKISVPLNEGESKVKKIVNEIFTTFKAGKTFEGWHFMPPAYRGGGHQVDDKYVVPVTINYTTHY